MTTSPAPSADATISPRFSAKNRADLERLAASLTNIPTSRKIAIASRCFADGLMMMPIWVRAALWLGIKRHGRLNAYRLMFSQTEARAPGHIDDTWKQIIDHMLNGKDREDVGSAGGFSQRELDMFVDYFGSPEVVKSAALTTEGTGAGAQELADLRLIVWSMLNGSGEHSSTQDRLEFEYGELHVEDVITVPLSADGMPDFAHPGWRSARADLRQRAKQDGGGHVLA